MTTTPTTFEHLSVELLYEIFIYFQFHEVFNIFSNLNSRFDAIINNMPLMPVYLGLNGMSLAVTEFYYTYLSQSNVCNRLISLCVSNTLAIDNGLPLVEHLSRFINLRYLSLIDIKRSSFELILNAFSSNNSLIMFSLHFPTYYRAAYTFEGIPEGAYYERIFQLFPLLRLCHLRFRRCTQKTLDDSQIVLLPNQAFIPIRTRLLNLQSILLEECSLTFLLHMLEHLPQLQELNFSLAIPWLSDKHPLMNGHNTRVLSIDKRLVPNLRRLKIRSKYDRDAMELPDGLFDRDVLFSLTNFTLVGKVTGSYIVRKLLSMLNDQCSYVLNVRWWVKTAIPLSDTSAILLDTFRQLKGPVPIELELSLEINSYSIRASTIPTIEKYLCAFTCVSKHIVRAQSHCPSIVQPLNDHLICINEIFMPGNQSQIKDEFLSYLPNICSLHRITSLKICDPSHLWQLRLLLSKMINLRTLQLNYYICDSDNDSDKQYLIDFLNDTSICTILMSNGLQKLHLYAHKKFSDMIDIAHLIVKALPHLQIIELNCHDGQVPEILHIFMNGLSKLTFLMFYGGWRGTNQQHSKMCEQKYSTRAYRMEHYNEFAGDTMLYVWL